MSITLKATFSQIVFRVIFAYILAPYFGFSGIAFACLAGWIAMLAYELPNLFRWKKLIN